MLAPFGNLKRANFANTDNFTRALSGCTNYNRHCLENPVSVYTQEAVLKVLETLHFTFLLTYAACNTYLNHRLSTCRRHRPMCFYWLCRVVNYSVFIPMEVNQLLLPICQMVVCDYTNHSLLINRHYLDWISVDQEIAKSCDGHQTLWLICRSFADDSMKMDTKSQSKSRQTTAD